MNHSRQTLPVLVLATLCGSTPLARAQTLSYPELSVAPRASDRLQQESVIERQRKYSTHLPIQASALVTLVAGLTALGDPGKGGTPKGEDPGSYWAGITGCAIGAGWLAITGLMSTMYTPYKSGLDAIKGMPTRTPLEQLTRERAAEEEINAPARLGTRLTILSLTTQLAANAYIIGTAGNDVTRVMGGLGAVMSLAPTIFSYRWNMVADYQNDYKKRIYGPLSTLSINPLIVPTTRTEEAFHDGVRTVVRRPVGLMPMMNIAWTY